MIYTKTGDKGQTALANGERVDKCHPQITLVGEIDELQALCEWAGLIQFADIRADLMDVVRCLFFVGGFVGTEAGEADAALLASQSVRLEERIDALCGAAFSGFVFIGAAEASARLNLARAVCRRAERAACALYKERPALAPVLIYLNRLSDYLFAAARAQNERAGVPEQRATKP